MSDPILVEGLSKRFRRYPTDRPWTLQEAVLRGFRGMKTMEYFWALKEISFRVPAGRMTGLIGRNGAGKSTLLRLVGGVGQPTNGHIFTQGRIGALIELGAGFHPDLTGRENIYINGVISGLTRQEVGRRFDSIVEFSELRDFIDNPFRTYSTGMRMRLAFSVAVHTDPDILLIDEVLAVGDMAFQQKCLNRIKTFKQHGCAILLVSHDTSLVEDLCDQVIWLNEGKIQAKGPANMVVHQYVHEMQSETQRRTPSTWPSHTVPTGQKLQVNENRFGSLEMEIQNVQILNSEGNVVTKMDSGEALCVEFDYNIPQEIDSPIFGVTITQPDGLICYEVSTAAVKFDPHNLGGRGKVALHIRRLDLMGGTYLISVGAYKNDWSYAYDYHWQVYSIKIEPQSSGKGVLRPPHEWEINGSRWSGLS